MATRYELPRKGHDLGQDGSLQLKHSLKELTAEGCPWQTPRSWGNGSFISGRSGWGITVSSHEHYFRMSVLAAQEPSMQSILIITECYFHLSSQISFYDYWQMPKDLMSVEDLFERFPHMLPLVWDSLLRTFHLQKSSFKFIFLSFLHISEEESFLLPSQVNFLSVPLTWSSWQSLALPMILSQASSIFFLSNEGKALEYYHRW